MEIEINGLGRLTKLKKFDVFCIVCNCFLFQVVASPQSNGHTGYVTADQIESAKRKIGEHVRAGSEAYPSKNCESPRVRYEVTVEKITV